ncbi:hypothetical protein ABZ260_17460 [Streptosporangium sp. NPDC006013]|uniref:hypothetical protein n=1 Tax=Streptosporangium sp. NPDC006013 TaxID=3155596 RepID=UPI0033B4FE0B
MKLWQAPARTLPITIRPIGGETIPSYARRLAEANDLYSTVILRAIGEHRYGTGRHLFRHDACLNDQAADRLAVFAGMPRDRLRRALPALSQGLPAYQKPLPMDRPAVYTYTPIPNPRPACHHCQIRNAVNPNPPTVLVRTTDPRSPLICYRHRRWLGNLADTTQYDLRHADEIITAERRYQRLLAGRRDTGWVSDLLITAWNITQAWATHPPIRLPTVVKWWRARAVALGIPDAPRQPIVTFPEAVTLTEILTNLDWRQHVAMAEDYDLGRFYQHITRSLGETHPQSAQATHRIIWGQRDALTYWVAAHRHRFRDLRLRHQAEQRRQWVPKPFPEKGHFR